MIRYFPIFLLILLTTGCGTRATKGTPINEVPQVKIERAAATAMSVEEHARLTAMSKIRENSVFKIVDGIPEYRIGPLDVLEITSRVGDELKKTQVVVNNRGLISYSFVDDLKVAGLTATEADALLTKRLRDFLKRPRIDILVKEFNSKQVSLLGEVASLRQTGDSVKLPSGKIVLTGRVTLMELLSQASGYTQNADLRKIRLIRDGRSYAINMYDIIENGADWMNVIIDDGDVLDIPEGPEIRRKVYVMGEVPNQGPVDMRKAETLLDALSSAGMYSKVAREENTLIVRRQDPGEPPLVMVADVDAMLNQGDLSQNIALKDGDLVFVPREFIGDINEWIGNHTTLLNFIFYPRKFQSNYFYRDYLKFDTKEED